MAEAKDLRPQEWTTAEIAAHLQLPISTIHYWTREGLIRPARRVGRTQVFGAEAIDRAEYTASRRRQRASLSQIRRELASFSWRAPRQARTPAHTTAASATAAANTTRPTYLVFANQKGGVGKTTSATNVGAALAAAQQRVLLIDWDPQANASQALGLSPQDVEGGPSVFDCVNRADLPLAAIIRPTSVPGLDLAPANIQLSGLELDLAQRLGREFTLRSICRAGLETSRQYDWVIIDMPPTLGLIAINALVAADIVVIPVQAEYLPLEGVRQLVNTIETVRQRLNATLMLGAVVVTMFTAEPLRDSIRRHINEVFGSYVLVALIPYSPQVPAAQAKGAPLRQLWPADPAAVAYDALAQQLLALKPQPGVQRAAPVVDVAPIAAEEHPNHAR